MAKDFVGPDREPNEIRPSLWNRLVKSVNLLKPQNTCNTTQDHFNVDPESGRQLSLTKIHSKEKEKGETAAPLENPIMVNDELLK